MTADSWKSFATDGPPQVGQDVLLIAWKQEQYSSTLITKWSDDTKIPQSGWTHWTPFTPPEKEDWFDKWWLYEPKSESFIRIWNDKLNVQERVALKAMLESIWTEAARQADERHEKLHPASGMADPTTYRPD